MEHEEIILVGGRKIHAAQPTTIPNQNFIGREDELVLCMAAWGIDDNYNLIENNAPPLHFRLEGLPGMGKNEIVYELARRLGMELYIVQGHEEFTPEDLALLIVPDTAVYEDDDYYDEEYITRQQQFILRASPLATALYKGALCFFDEINRVPERALSPLSSVLDGRFELHSAMTSIKIEPKDEEARRSFRFCCALNPKNTEGGKVLPDYIEQRTLPVIDIDPPPLEDVLEILDATLKPEPEFLESFSQWYEEQENQNISVRQALALMNYAMTLKSSSDESELSVLEKVKKLIMKY